MNAVVPLKRFSPMDAALKERWIARLESGEYAQGQGQLRDRGNNYCCLGVLYEVAGKEWQYVDGEWCTAELTGDDCYDTVYPDPYNFPNEYRREFGLEDEAEAALIELNDTKGWDFQQIANWIKENL